MGKGDPKFFVVKGKIITKMDRGNLKIFSRTTEPE
jgi:hypothetical protein